MARRERVGRPEMQDVNTRSLHCTGLKHAPSSQSILKYPKPYWVETIMSLPLKALTALFTTVLLAGCGPRVMVEQATGVQLPGAGTYALGMATDHIAGEQSPRVNSDIIAEKVQHAIATGLDRRGYQQVEKSEAAWLVHYHAGLEKQSQTTTETSHPVAPRVVCGAYRCTTVYDWGFYGPPEAITHTITFHEGTLLLDIHDAKTSKLVWRGTLSGEVNVNKPLNQSTLQQAIDKLLKKLPAASHGSKFF